MIVAAIREITLSGRSGRIVEMGEGPSIVLLASQLVRLQPYRPLFLHLAEHFHVTALELPGCGGASRLDRGWSCGQYAQWLAEFLQQRQFHRPLLIAHSTSCGAAMVLAARHPDLLAGLILAGSIGVPRAFLPILLGRALDAFIEWRLSLSRWYDLLHTALFHSKNFFHQIRIAASDNLSTSAKRITIPTLLAHGRRDHTVPLSSARALHHLIPNSRLNISPTGSHDWLITHSDEFTTMTRLFARDIGILDNAQLRLTRPDHLIPSPLHWPVPQ